MSNILSEISRVREIMGVLKEQSNEEQVLDADVITPSEENISLGRRPNILETRCY